MNARYSPLVDVLQRIDGRWRVVFSQNTAIGYTPGVPESP